ncbi:MAG TPA: 23S rRNA (guanosine(2251)-2'-O)-methyltransferase RlmB [Chitinophagales bacterium]|jgi:23S rRNA (guanosine2251-2'-O)-methyltransferase|nr:23S rRNA (guanosine(2251)-2'-O)-methyltransferase RlmB [Chitinophagales bacterium]MBP6153912.1 23S rRNA (guanosine(2251)-2'-O)-methyltransferase RlmB [Chitinophagales bacterium]HQV78740.1 23S rRNA (guanosine(2251)-2'-O)-methyltransferase RlmB [Chitinophagales bacterium]HQW79106.1 23S rRNA (guanosine(2251)-2'-O)-methyltransferase RlmB [Chitinophagales bacterium]HRB68102.1 23S rRNA (guanosine(2251)-2'-O)-methyltransferase RlmB [Chitinophagales bacterium]
MAKQQLIAGRNPVLELLQSTQEVEKVLISKNANGDVIKQIIQLCKEKEVYFQYVPEIKINSLSKANHQGVLAFTSLIQYQEVQKIIDFVFEKGEDPLLLILENITDVRNLGALARTALGLGVHAIIFPKKESAAINDVAVKISAGALLKIPVCRVDNLIATLKDIKNNGIKLIGLDGTAEKFIQESNTKMPLAIVSGSEDEGISNTVVRLLDELVKLPMHSDLESYNVSVATAMALYEVHRQK